MYDYRANMYHMVFRKAVCMAKETTRVTYNLTSELVEQVREYADNMNINMTSAVSVLLSTALNGQKAMSDLNKLMKAYEDEQKKAKATE